MRPVEESRSIIEQPHRDFVKLGSRPTVTKTKRNDNAGNSKFVNRNALCNWWQSVMPGVICKDQNGLDV